MNSAFEKGVDLLSRREHSEKEIRQKLRMRGFEKKEIDESIIKLLEYNYLSDIRYAQLLYQSCKRKGYGVQKIKIKFQQKGLSWSEEFKELDLEDAHSGQEELMMSQWLEKKVRFLKDSDGQKKTYEKLLSFLIRKGFSYERAQKKVKNFMEELKQKSIIFFMIALGVSISVPLSERALAAEVLNDKKEVSKEENHERVLGNEFKDGAQLFTWFEKGVWYYALFPATNSKITPQELEKYKKKNIETFLPEFEKLSEKTTLYWNTHKLSFIQQANPPAKEVRQLLGAARKKEIKILR